jgi:type I restriction enzyme M protein
MTLFQDENLEAQLLGEVELLANHELEAEEEAQLLGEVELLANRELESHLWEAANILRGSPVDRTDWKSYILPLLFFKRICDVWDEEHADARRPTARTSPTNTASRCPRAATGSDVRDRGQRRHALSNAMRGIEAANQKHLYGVFGDAQWTNKDRLPDELLKDLIEHFSALPLGNARVRHPTSSATPTNT